MQKPQRNCRKQNSKKNDVHKDDGFAQWGGYMAAKRAKLLEQFHGGATEKISDIFNGVAIFVNGLTDPSANELKYLMFCHGGLYHMYQVSSTTHIIASNLPNVKVKHLGSVPIVKPSWITESIALRKLLDYRRYLLYTNQSITQPHLSFPCLTKPEQDTDKSMLSQNMKLNLSEMHTILDLSKNGNIKTNSTLNQTYKEQNKIIKTTSDPKFLQEFYNNSRLHLISTLGAEFKLLVNQLREKSDERFAGRQKLLALKGKQLIECPATVIMHIDMDCFFVSVGLKNNPELRGKPVAIAHARSGVVNVVDPKKQSNRAKEFDLYCQRLPKGAPSRVADIKNKIECLGSMSEIASCSYEARQFGIKNGMFLGAAISLCPELRTLPYDFQGYKDVSNILYTTMASYTLDIEAISCDEMFVDITSILEETGLSVDEWGTYIRNEILTATGCPCSTGFGANRLQARLATRKAKPAGQYHLKPNDVESYMSSIMLADLPGVGRATLAKFKKLNLRTCGDVQQTSLKILQAEIGQKAGETLKEQAFGRNSKPLNFSHERKSVSAEVNYGIRFKSKEEAYIFLESLSNEVFNRLSHVGMRARSLTLKLLVRAPEAPVETAKFLGHGVCDALTKSTTSNAIINDPKTIFREVKLLYEKLNPICSDLRGVGIHLAKLEKNIPTNTALNKFFKRGSYFIKKVSTENDHKSDIETAENVTDVTVYDMQNGNAHGSSNNIGSNYIPKVQCSDMFRMIKEGDQTVKRAFVTTTKIGEPTVAKHTSKIPNSTLNKFKAQEKVLPNLEIDFNVLNELPEDIKNEIMQQYKLSPLKLFCDKNGLLDIPAKSSQTIAENKENGEAEMEKGHSNSSSTIQKRKSLFEDLSWKEMKPIIKSWIVNEDKPNKVDVDILAEHFRNLAMERKLEILKHIFNFLFRALSSLNCSWHKAYYSMLEGLQQGMLERYGNTLLVDGKFYCCQ